MIEFEFTKLIQVKFGFDNKNLNDKYLSFTGEFKTIKGFGAWKHLVVSFNRGWVMLRLFSRFVSAGKTERIQGSWD